MKQAIDEKRRRSAMNATTVRRAIFYVYLGSLRIVSSLLTASRASAEQDCRYWLFEITHKPQSQNHLTLWLNLSFILYFSIDLAYGP